MFSTSITNGAMATTRSSTMAVVQVVQPRFDPPATTKVSTLALPPASLARNSVTASIARTADLVIGKRAGHFSSPVLRNLSHV